MTDTRIGQNTEVTLHFALHLENGDTVDSTFDKAPATFKVGDGNLLPGFEAALFGFKAGDKRTVVVAPENAFGQPTRRTYRSCHGPSSRAWNCPKGC
jgi:FKBP-type peptidyl-prolyl cis-trans isomerase SlpA